MSDEPLHNPHDRFFKEALGRKDAAVGFFPEFLPPGLAGALDWENIRRLESSFVDETLRERYSDLLFSVTWKGRELLLYCFFEHQRDSDRWMAFRLLRAFRFAVESAGRG
jgi:recombination-promoting nuclease RpnA